MDILALVDRLEELFNNSRPIPLTHNVIVDEDKFLDIIDQMRITIPEEVKKAQKIFSEKDRILAQAQEESTRIAAKAREKAEQLVDENMIVQEANHRADQIIEQARMEAEGIKADGDQYALDSLTEFELKVEQLLNQIRNGILVLENKKNPPGDEKKTQGDS
jgi:vacuolar-type H+-ATPase subunit H